MEFQSLGVSYVTIPDKIVMYRISMEFCRCREREGVGSEEAKRGYGVRRERERVGSDEGKGGVRSEVNSWMNFLTNSPHQ